MLLYPFRPYTFGNSKNIPIQKATLTPLGKALIGPRSNAQIKSKPLPGNNARS